jgi:hypothetical protein
MNHSRFASIQTSDNIVDCIQLLLHDERSLEVQTPFLVESRLAWLYMQQYELPDIKAFLSYSTVIHGLSLLGRLQ